MSGIKLGIKKAVYKKATWVALVMMLLYFLLYLGVFFYNKVWDVNGDLVNFTPISIDKGDYALSVDYSSSEQLLLESVVNTKGQQFVINKVLLEPADNAGVVVPISIPYDVRNDGFTFRVTPLGDGGFEIRQIGLNYVGTPIWELVVLLTFIILLALIILEQNGREATLEVVFTGMNLIILHDVFVENSLFMLIYAVLIGLCAFRVIKFNRNAQTFIMIYLIVLCVMCFFSPVSPLFTRGICRDSGAYYAMAKGIVEGKIPYRDMFDHKGPLLYVLYVIGYILSPGEVGGLYIVEVLFMSFAVYIIKYIASRYMSENASLVAAFLSFVVLFDRAYTAGGTEPEQWYMGLFLMAILFMLKDDNKLIGYFIQGLAFTLVFYTKFNVSVPYVVIICFCGLRLLCRKEYKQLIKAVVSYCLAFGGVSLILIIYYGLNNALIAFYNTYFKFNLIYSTTSGTAASRIIERIYGFYTENKIIFILSLVGILMFVIANRFADIFSKAGIVVSYVAMLYAVLCGGKVYEYYYCNVAVYAVLGVIVIVTYLSEYSAGKLDNPKCAAFALVLATFLSFTVNDMILSSDLVDLEPKMQDILAYEMKSNAKADASFIEWDMLEVGIYPAMDIAPQFRYFYQPNLSGELFSEPFSEMIRYAQEQGPEYIVGERFSTEDYLTGDLVTNYELMSMYETLDGTGRTFMVYQRK